jgi:hypothetical protein
MGMQPLPHRFASHAYFPRHAVDQVCEHGSWTFGRKGNGYVALWCSAPTTWMAPDPDILAIQFPDNPPAIDEAQPYERLAEGDDHAWVCELGNQTGFGRFDQFVARILEAEVGGTTEALHYESPGEGRLTCGWDAPLMVKGQVRL